MSSMYVVFGMFAKATEENRARPLDEWARLANFKNPKRVPEEKRASGLYPLDNLYGRWSIADLWCQCCLQDCGEYLCFQIFTSWDDVSDYGLPPYGEVIRDKTLTLEEEEQIFREEPSFYKDPRVRIAEEFAGACVAVGAEVGVYTKTLLYKPGFIEIQEWLKEFVYDPGVRVRDIRAVFESHWKVLFLNDELYYLLLKQYPGVYVDELLWVTDVLPGIPPGSHGALLFKNSGRYRF